MNKFELINLLKDCSIAMNVPVLLINQQNKLIYRFPDSFENPPKVLRELHRSYIEESKKRPFAIQLFTDPYDQHLFLYPVKDQHGKDQVIGVGPFLEEEILRMHVKNNLIMNGLDSSLEEQFVGYFEQLPILNQVQMNSIKGLLNQLLPKQEKEVKNVWDQEKIHKQYQNFTQSLHSYSDMVASKQKFLDLFKKGEESSIDAYQQYQEKIAENQDVRSRKNQMIRLVTELGYICLDKGAHQDEVESLCDFYINFLETKDTIAELISLELNILHSFLDRIRKVDDVPQNSPLVDRTQRYIFQNLSENLTLRVIADALNVNPNYLSGVFTKENGVSITHFINQQRIKEAKELLCITRHSLMDISMLLGYNSQSYFTRVFKSMEGIGPREFRQKYQVHE